MQILFGNEDAEKTYMASEVQSISQTLVKSFSVWFFTAQRLYNRTFSSSCLSRLVKLNTQQRNRPHDITELTSDSHSQPTKIFIQVQKTLKPRAARDSIEWVYKMIAVDEVPMQAVRVHAKIVNMWAVEDAIISCYLERRYRLFAAGARSRRLGT